MSFVRPSKKMAAVVFGIAAVVTVAYGFLRAGGPTGMMDYLQDSAGNPVAYAVLLFVYGVAATVFLPIPVELGLLLAPEFPLLGKALIMGSAKALGGFAILQIGVRLEDDIRHWSERVPAYAALVKRIEAFVHAYGNVAIFIVLAIPFMVDTVPLYLFAMFNEKGRGLDRRGFIAANFAGGFVRAVLTVVFQSFVIQFL